MAKYKDIGGTTVRFSSGAEEYTYPSGAEGSLYYNSANGNFAVSYTHLTLPTIYSV